MAHVICFAGQIGSGKSSISKAVAARLGWDRASFGDFVRVLLESRGGDPGSREQLQELGQSLVDSDPVTFCKLVLASGGYEVRGNLVVDGIRHVSIYRALQELVRPDEATLIYLSVPEAERIIRVNLRDGESSDLGRVESHPVESQAMSVKAASDVVIDASRPLEDVIDACLECIARLSAA